MVIYCITLCAQGTWKIYSTLSSTMYPSCIAKVCYILLQPDKSRLGLRVGHDAILAVFAPPATRLDAAKRHLDLVLHTAIHAHGSAVDPGSHA